MYRPVITDFTAGELSPKFSGRIELELYNKGAAEITNWVPFTQGGVRTRPGLRYIGATKANASTRLIAFDVGDDAHFILEMGDSYIRPWSGTARAQTLGVDVEVATPYSATEVWNLQYQQVANQMYFVCDSQPIYVLTYSDLTFSFDALEISCADNIDAWVDETAYSVSDMIVTPAGLVYECITAGTSSAGDLPEANSWTSVCWSPDLAIFCAVASSGTHRVMTSEDGMNWTAQSAAEANSWQSVCWSAGLALFVAVASDGTNRVMTSPDGETWTARSAASASEWKSVCWSVDKAMFVAVGYMSKIMTSTNGTSWTSRSAYGSATNFESVAYSQSLGRFVAVASNVSGGPGDPWIEYSANGTTWSAATSYFANPRTSICWSSTAAKFVTVGHDAQLLRSATGTSWTLQSAVDSNYWNCVCESDTTRAFCAVASTGTYRVITSSDGVTWTRRSAAEANSWTSVCYSSALGLYVAVASSGTHRAMVSSDGATWETCGQGPPPSEESDDVTDGTVHWKYLYQTPFNRAGDYPSCIAHFAGRMWYAASDNEPQKVWASVPFEYGNFNYSDAISYSLTKLKAASSWSDPLTPETETISETKIVYGDGNALSFEIASEQLDAIKWLAGADALIIGTSSSEWVVQPDVTALNIVAKRRSGLGSSAIQAQMFGDCPVFVQAGDGGGLLREYNYVSQSAELQSPDLTFAADQMLEYAAVQMDFAQLPQPSMFIVTSDGDMSVLLYNKPYNITAWYRFTTENGSFKSVAVVAGSSTDDVYVVVNRGGVYTIERFDGLWDGTRYCLDSWVEVASIAGATQSGLDRMDGESASIYNITDGTWSSATVTSGSLSYPTGCGVGDNVIIGLPITCDLQTMRIPLSGYPGAGMGSTKRIVGVIVRVLNSFPFEVSADGVNYETARRVDEQPWDDAYTGDVIVPVPGDWNRDGWLYFRQDLPQITTILALVPEIDS